MNDYLILHNSNCKNCYKCIRQCPTKSIRFSDGRASIIDDQCVLCGKCYSVCPQPNKKISSDVLKVTKMLEDGQKVIASLSPSFVAYFNTGAAALERALKKIGFFGAEESALAAAAVKNEYGRIIREQRPEIFITSCCHSVNLLVQMHFPSLLKYLAPVKSIMTVHIESLKSRYPDSKTVYVCPCVSEKDEAKVNSSADAVLSFDELKQMLDEKGVIIETDFSKDGKIRGRLFATSGGIIKCLDSKEDGYAYTSVSGVTHCYDALKEIENGNLKNCFIEMNACRGGCVGGPLMGEAMYCPISSYQKVVDCSGDEEPEFTPAKDIHKSFAQIGENQRMPTEAEIKEILIKTGKTHPEQELNCGSCGYDTCRDKAKAIFLGKADPDMCLPYLNEKAESFSSNIVNNSFNAVFVLDDDYKITLINRAARKIIGEPSRDIIGKHVTLFFDPKYFISAKLIGRGFINQKVYLEKYNIYVEQTVIYDREYHTLICEMRDISEEETARLKKEAFSKRTVEIADKVVEKQMRIVQDIASLLGETAAETKIALFNLKESISDD